MKTVRFMSLEFSGIQGGTLSDDVLKSHLEKLKGLKVTTYIEEIYTEAIIDFEYKNFEFSADNAFFNWRFSVHENCSEEIRNEIRLHCSLLGPVGK